jgi:hypothetical protein
VGTKAYKGIVGDWVQDIFVKNISDSGTARFWFGGISLVKALLEFLRMRNSTVHMKKSNILVYSTNKLVDKLIFF